MRDQTIENNGCEGEYNNCDSNAIFFFLSIIQTLVTIEHANLSLTLFQIN